MIKISLQTKKIKTNLKGFFLSFCNGFFFFVIISSPDEQFSN